MTGPGRAAGRVCPAPPAGVVAFARFIQVRFEEFIVHLGDIRPRLGRGVRRVAAVAALLAAAGCGKNDGPDLYTVSGVVTYDGSPVPDGRIVFRKVDEGNRAYSAAISNGEYKLDCEAGKVAVEVTASKLVPGKVDRSNGTPEPVGVMYIPKRYNAASTLTADVAPSKDNQIPFTLKSN